MPEVPGLSIQEVIGRGTHSTVYRAVYGTKTYALKLLEPDESGDDQRVQETCRLAATLARAKHPALPRIAAVGKSPAGVYVASEFVEGPTLAAEISAGPYDESRIVRLGRSLAGGLAKLHELGLVHRDVKPDNIVLGSGDQPVLVDFDLVARLESASEEVSGTLLYAPPEQTGALRRPVDARSDLYSLGAVLFECATGRSPFGAAGPSSIPGSADPPALRDLNPAISPALAAVISKLLAPEPDDRYQSAHNLLDDLDLIPLLSAEAAGNSTLLFEAEPQPLPLAGRDSEFDKLRHLWREALRDRGRVVLLRGPSGSGKTHLAQAFLTEVQASGRLVLMGRCAEGESVPFGALRRALDEWLASFGHMVAAQRALAEQRLRIAAGDFAGLLRVLSPAFEQAFAGLQPAGDISRLRERFYDILAEFLLKLAGCYGGLAFFLDDVQWLDTSTQEVLRRVGMRLEGAPLLVLAAIRTDSHGRALRPGSHTSLSTDTRFQIRLTPLTEAATGQLVAYLLGEDYVSADIVNHVAAWTNGNPLAISEYVESLLDAGVLRPEWGTWSLDTSGLERLRLPRDVAQLLAVRVANLEPTQLEVLRIAALVGGRIQPAALRAIVDDTTAIDDTLAVGLRSNLIRSVADGAFEFTHDSVRDGLLSGLPSHTTRDLHERIAESLDSLPEDQQQQHLFAIARHFALGQRAGNAQRVYETNLAAGLAAMRSLADAEAYEFLLQARRTAQSIGLTDLGDLDEALGEVCGRAGRWDEAMAYLSSALEQIDEPLRRAGMYAHLARVRVANRETLLAWREVELGFEAMGMSIGRNKVTRVLFSLWAWISGMLSLRIGLGYGSAKGEQRERLKMQSQLYIIGAYAAYLLHDNLKTVEMVTRQLRLGHLMGDSVELASALTAYGNVLAMLSRPEAAARYSERSLVIVNRLNDRFHLARLRMFQAWQRHLAGQPRQAEAAMRRCLQLDGSWLDAADFAYSHIDLAWNLMMRGYLRESLDFLELALKRSQPGSGEARNIEIKVAALQAALGRPGEALERAARARPTDADPDDWLKSGYYSYLALLLLELGELGEPMEEALEKYHSASEAGPAQTSFHGRHFYVFQAYARLEQCMTKSSPEAVQRLHLALNELREIADHPTIRSHYLVARAVFERLQGRPQPALRQLLAAEECALEADSLWAQFEQRRQLAHTMAALDNHEAAMRQARDAYRLAVAQGWVHRAQVIRSEFEGLRAAPESAFADTRPGRDGVAEERDPERLGQHLEALLQVSLAASSTLEPARQAQVALDEILRVLQAQRAFLFTVTAYGELELRAGRNAEGDDLPDLTGYSRTVVETVRTTCEPVIVSGTEQQQIQPTDSIRAHDLRSIIAAPLLMKGDLLGVVYVDSQLARGAFTEDDARILLAIANHIAIALQNASAVAQQTALTRANSDLLEALRLQVAELRASRGQITAAEERLRRDIAEMLHSRVQSKLLVAAHQLGQAVELIGGNPEEAKRLLTLSQEQLEDVREHDIRDASHQLHPSIIRIGLAPAVRSLIGRFEHVFKVSLDVESRLAKLDSIVDNHIPEEIRLTAYRAVEEALANIARHAQASEVHIGLSLTDDDHLYVRVMDNGVGFDATQIQPGLGTGSIEGRVNQLGGSWKISSTPGQGASVEVRLPL